MSTPQDTLSPNDHHDQMVAKLALAYNLISSEQYLKTLSIRSETVVGGKPPRLTAILVDRGFVSADQLDFLHQAKDMITQKRKEKRYGSLAVSQGYITEDELGEALAIQKREKKEIGRILLDEGFLTDEQHTAILHLQATTQVQIPTLEEMRRMIEEKNGITLQKKDAVILNVSQDALRAVLVLPESRRDVSLREIRSFLDDQGICFGMVDDEAIEDCLACRNLGVNAFIVARGQTSVPPETGPMVYHFEHPPLDLDIDTGRRPMVRKGECLAEREILRPGKPRITVYGASLDETGVSDGLFIPGNGTRMDEAQGSILSMHDGEPFRHPDGAVCVLKELLLHDEGLKAGPVRHDGTLRVTASISPGADITAVHIVAGSIDGAVIKADGNLWVDGELSGTTVISAGSVHARAISGCTISCVGDVFSETDIIDSEIRTLCRCKAAKKINKSSIYAARGIEAQAVVSGKDRPSILEFGKEEVPAYISGEEEAVMVLEESIQDLVSQIHARESMLGTTGQVISEIRREMDKNERERSMLSQSVSHMEQKSKRDLATGRNRLVTLGLDIQAARDTLEVLAKDMASITDSMASMKKTLGIKMREYKELKAKITRITSLMKERLSSHPRLKGVRVLGVIQATTCIQGPHAKTVLAEDLTRVMISESQLPDHDPALHTSHTLDITPF